MEPHTHPGRGLSKTSLALHSLLLGCLGVLTVVPLLVGGPARVVALLAGVGLVLAIGVLVYRVAKSGGSLRITRELMAFGGERIYFRDIEAVERGLPDRANQTFRIEVRTRETVHRLDLMDYRIDPAVMPALLDGMQRAVASGKRDGRPALDELPPTSGSPTAPGQPAPSGPSDPPVTAPGDAPASPGLRSP